jgi:Family of unknown function (DUF6184)
MLTRFLPLALLAASATFAACTYRDSMTATPTNVRTVSTQSATVRIAQARCDLENKCGRVGEHMRYATARDCMGELMRDTEQDLSPQICPVNIPEARLEKCLDELQNESCEPLSPTRRMVTCDPRVLCVQPSGEPYHPEEVYGP